MRLGTDSGEYEILAEAAALADKHEGLSIELGLREGGGTQYMIEQYTKPKTHIAIDPYGSLPYEWMDGVIANWVYDNSMRNEALAALYQKTVRSPVNFLFFNLTDQQFFDRFSTGVPIFENGSERLETVYSIVHFDAVHAVRVILNEIDFFLPRTSEGSIFVFDDVEGFYDHSQIEKKMLENGWRVLKKGSKKASYIR